MAELPTRFERIARLVGHPSVSCLDPAFDTSNAAVIAQLADWLEPLGFAVEVTDVGEGKRNLVATYGKGEGGLVLAGHTDTVPCNPELWTSDPFTLTEREGNLYGLGSADMKGFLALACEVALELDVNTVKRPLVIVATADEESSFSGASALVTAGRPLGRHAVVGEPTCLKPLRAHKGVMMEALEIVGRSGHSSDPSLGNNALEGMHAVIAALLAYRDELSSLRNPVFAVPTPTINLGSLHGGDNPNRICGQCELTFDVRVMPGMDADEVRREIQQRAEAAVAGKGLTVNYRALFGGAQPFEVPPDAPIVKAVEELTDAPATAGGFATESPFYQQLGADPVVLGPGDISVAHQPDEYLPIADLEPTVTLLKRLVKRFCVDT